ncbi:MAG: flagellar basal body-associated protein FliL [Glaciimonas sp.]|nr:flagellar basal body-associated protein FliL [Glaciimonas sp.]
MMAKAAPKEDVKADPAEEKPGKSRKKLFLIMGIAIIAIGVGGSAGALYLNKKNVSGKNTIKNVQEKPPVFLNLDSFTVNLQSEDGSQYLQIAFTLQVEDDKQVEIFKQNMPQVRNRLLMLLSSKKPSEIASTEGKKKLSNEIVALLKQPFYPQGKPQSVSSVFFTSFIIQ